MCTEPCVLVPTRPMSSTSSADFSASASAISTAACRTCMTSTYSTGYLPYLWSSCIQYQEHAICAVRAGLHCRGYCGSGYTDSPNSIQRIHMPKCECPMLIRYRLGYSHNRSACMYSTTIADLPLFPVEKKHSQAYRRHDDA